MTRKSVSSRRGVVWLGWKLVIAFSVSLCLLALLRIQMQYRSPVTTTLSVAAGSRDDITLRDYYYSGDRRRPKVAFLFLARRDLPLDFLWDSFFKVLRTEYIF